MGRESAWHGEVTTNGSTSLISSLLHPQPRLHPARHVKHCSLSLCLQPLLRAHLCIRTGLRLLPHQLRRIPWCISHLPRIGQPDPLVPGESDDALNTTFVAEKLPEVRPPLITPKLLFIVYVVLEYPVGSATPIVQATLRISCRKCASHIN
jgi:hypothetical protein